MTDNHIYKDLRDRFADYSESVDDSCWESISKSLDSLQRQRRRRIFIYRFSAVAAAAVLLFGLVLNWHGSKLPAGNQSAIAVVEESDSLLRELPVEVAKDSLVLSIAEQIKSSRGVLAENIAAKEERVEEIPAKEAPAAEEIKVYEPVNQSEEAAVVENISDSEESVVEPAGTPESGSVNDFYRYIQEDNKVKRRRVKSFSVQSGLGNVSSSEYVSVRAPSYAPGVLKEEDLHYIEGISDVDYSIPLTVGLQAQLDISPRLAVGIGVNYSMLRSKYEGLMNKRYYDVTQTLHYIGVPINLYVSLIESKKLNLYANVGGTIEKGVRGSYKLINYDGQKEKFTKSIEGLEYSINGGFGLEYMFTRKFGLYLEPNLSYYLNSDVAASIRSAQPLQVKADIGLRIHLK